MLLLLGHLGYILCIKHEAEVQGISDGHSTNWPAIQKTFHSRCEHHGSVIHARNYPPTDNTTVIVAHFLLQSPWMVCGTERSAITMMSEAKQEGERVEPEKSHSICMRSSPGRTIGTDKFVLYWLLHCCCCSSMLIAVETLKRETTKSKFRNLLSDKISTKWTSLPRS